MSKINKNLSEIKNMWLVAMFDLPVTTNERRKEYSRFRKTLLSMGFIMLQYSVYAKFCSCRKTADQYKKYIRQALPHEGNVRVINITDKQFGDMEVYVGYDFSLPEEKPEQLLLF